jgi:hypothetical protein
LDAAPSWEQRRDAAGEERPVTGKPVAATRRQDAAPRRAMVGAVSGAKPHQLCDMRAMHRPAISGNQHEPAAGAEEAKACRRATAGVRLRCCGAERCEELELELELELRTAWGGGRASMKLWLLAPCYWHRARSRSSDDSGSLSAGLQRRFLRTQHARLCTYNATMYRREAQQQRLCTYIALSTHSNHHAAVPPRQLKLGCLSGAPPQRSSPSAPSAQCNWQPWSAAVHTAVQPLSPSLLQQATDTNSARVYIKDHSPSQEAHTSPLPLAPGLLQSAIVHRDRPASLLHRNAHAAAHAARRTSSCALCDAAWLRASCIRLAKLSFTIEQSGASSRNQTDQSTYHGVWAHALKRTGRDHGP